MRSLSERYPVWFCDVWGVVHNGHVPFAASVSTLARHRANGGTVILVTNSPRSRQGVEIQLREIGVAPESHDLVVTSGDVTRDLIVKRGGGQLFHLGPARDHSILDGLDVALTTLDQARSVLCTGLFDDTKDTLESYDALLADMAGRALPMICANPDKIVRSGDRILYCAGSLAERYAARGGKVLMAGKPFPPIYDLAMAEAASPARRAGSAQPGARHRRWPRDRHPGRGRLWPGRAAGGRWHHRRAGRPCRRGGLGQGACARGPNCGNGPRAGLAMKGM